MGQPVDPAALANMIYRYQQAYGDQLVVVPDGGTVEWRAGDRLATQIMYRGTPVQFQRDSLPSRAGILCLGLLVNGQPFGIIAVGANHERKEFRIELAQITFPAGSSGSS